MFLGDRLPYIQKVLFGNDKAEAKKAHDAIYNFSKEDFKHSIHPPSLAQMEREGGTAATRLGVGEVDGYGVTIRLDDCFFWGWPRSTSSSCTTAA